MKKESSINQVLPIESSDGKLTITADHNRLQMLHSEALGHIGSASCLIAMLKRNPDLVIKVTINSKKHWCCTTKPMLKLLEREILEADKCLDGKLNYFE